MHRLYQLKRVSVASETAGLAGKRNTAHLVHVDVIKFFIAVSHAEQAKAEFWPGILVLEGWVRRLFMKQSFVCARDFCSAQVSSGSVAVRPV